MTSYRQSLAALLLYITVVCLWLLQCTAVLNPQSHRVRCQDIVFNMIRLQTPAVMEQLARIYFACPQLPATWLPGKYQKINTPQWGDCKVQVGNIRH